MDNIFHERQESMLCARHCLNSLLQDSYFNEESLRDIAKQLDLSELSLASGIDEVEGKSANMDDDGFFSVQVMHVALGNLGLELVPYNSQREYAVNARTNMYGEKAFIINCTEHWFCIRKLGHQWFNMNSLLEFPELMNEVQLLMYIDTLRTGKTRSDVYFVKGTLPECIADKVLQNLTVTQHTRPKCYCYYRMYYPVRTRGADGRIYTGMVLGPVKWRVQTRSSYTAHPDDFSSGPYNAGTASSSYYNDGYSSADYAPAGTAGYNSRLRAPEEYPTDNYYPPIPGNYQESAYGHPYQRNFRRKGALPAAPTDSATAADSNRAKPETLSFPGYSSHGDKEGGADAADVNDAGEVDNPNTVGRSNKKASAGLPTYFEMPPDEAGPPEGGSVDGLDRRAPLMYYPGKSAGGSARNKKVFVTQWRQATPEEEDLYYGTNEQDQIEKAIKKSLEEEAKKAEAAAMEAGAQVGAPATSESGERSSTNHRITEEPPVMCPGSAQTSSISRSGNAVENGSAQQTQLWPDRINVDYAASLPDFNPDGDYGSTALLPSVSSETFPSDLKSPGCLPGSDSTLLQRLPAERDANFGGQSKGKDTLAVYKGISQPDTRMTPSGDQSAASSPSSKPTSGKTPDKVPKPRLPPSYAHSTWDAAPPEKPKRVSKSATSRKSRRAETTSTSTQTSPKEVWLDESTSGKPTMATVSTQTDAGRLQDYFDQLSLNSTSSIGSASSLISSQSSVSSSSNNCRVKPSSSSASTLKLSRSSSPPPYMSTDSLTPERDLESSGLSTPYANAATVKPPQSIAPLKADTDKSKNTKKVVECMTTPTEVNYPRPTIGNDGDGESASGDRIGGAQSASSQEEMRQKRLVFFKQ